MPVLLMLGDSLVEWGDWTGLLPSLTTINRGRAGEDVQGLSIRIAREIETSGPIDHILIMAGTNNLLMGDLVFPAIFRTMLARVTVIAPSVRLTVNGLFPMQRPEFTPAMITQVNQELAAAAAGCECHYLDPEPAFTRYRAQTPNPCFLEDGIHLSTLGYQAWATLIRSHLGETNLC